MRSETKLISIKRLLSVLVEVNRVNRICPDHKNLTLPHENIMECITCSACDAKNMKKKNIRKIKDS